MDLAFRHLPVRTLGIGTVQAATMRATCWMRPWLGLRPRTTPSNETDRTYVMLSVVASNLTGHVPNRDCDSLSAAVVSLRASHSRSGFRATGCVVPQNVDFASTEQVLADTHRQDLALSRIEYLLGRSIDRVRKFFLVKSDRRQMVSLIEMDCRQAGLVHRISVHWISDGCEICGMNSYASCVSWRVIPNQTRGPELASKHRDSVCVLPTSR